MARRPLAHAHSAVIRLSAERSMTARAPLAKPSTFGSQRYGKDLVA
jgi:hypothetical protein